MPLSAPFLSLFDPDVSVEGTVDPLSLQALAERLAERIFPFVTSRMSRIRFLTAISAGAVVCERFEDERAVDGVTPPWLVFEWYVVEALLRRKSMMDVDGGWGRGLPGLRKVKAVVDQGHRLGPPSYLKTPTVFGFTGVYRRLAYGLRMIDDDLVLLAEGGSLVEAWEKDQGLEGFRTGAGDGGSLRMELEEAVRDGLKKGFTSRPPSWPAWERVAKVFRPDQARHRERNVLMDALEGMEGRGNPSDSEALPLRRELVAALVGAGASISRAEEPEFLHRVAEKSSKELRLRLAAIDAYERLCAVLLDGFGLIRALSTENGERPVDEVGFSKVPLSRELATELGQVLEAVEESFDSLGAPEAVEPLLKRYSPVRTPDELFRALLDHHHEAQKDKPPDGKRPWVESGPRGIVVRAAYRVDARPERNPGYVHDYRCSSVSSFLRDLGRLS